jgi:hypothetical protein
MFLSRHDYVWIRSSALKNGRVNFASADSPVIESNFMPYLYADTAGYEKEPVSRSRRLRNDGTHHALAARRPTIS